MSRWFLVSLPYDGKLPSHSDPFFSYGTSVITLRLLMFIGLAITARLPLAPREADPPPLLEHSGCWYCCGVSCLHLFCWITRPRCWCVCPGFIQEHGECNGPPAYWLQRLDHPRPPPACSFGRVRIRKRYHRRTEDSLYSSVSVEVVEKMETSDSRGSSP